MRIPLSDCPYEFGDIVSFVPACCGQATAGFVGELNRTVSGPVVQISDAHRWYRVAYETAQGTRYECFKY